MSRASFPRPEYLTLLRQEIEEWLRARPLRLEVTEPGLDHYRCRYRCGLRRLPQEAWMEPPVHLQIAERLETGGEDQELHRLLDAFVDRYFPQTELQDFSG